MPLPPFLTSPLPPFLTSPLAVPLRFYYVDLVLILIAYVPCMCIVAWHLENNEAATVRARLMDVLYTSALETIVAAATLVYCLFMMPFFFTLTNAWYQVRAQAT